MEINDPITRASTSSAARMARAHCFSLLVALVALGVALTVTAIPGVFTVDEPNYLVSLLSLRDGRVTVAELDGLPESRELAWFDPQGASRKRSVAPIASTAPPLWAILAYPFALFGWRGLVLLNTLAYLATTAMVFFLAARTARTQPAGWWAAAAFAFGAFNLEYAQGVWPQSLSLALVFGSFALVIAAIEKGSVALGILAGVSAGLATGVRYPNVVTAATVLVLLPFLERRRLRLTLAFALGLAIPLGASATINHARYGSFNPISKGPGYLKVGAHNENLLADTALLVWSRVVDYSARPPSSPDYGEGWQYRDRRTGAWIVVGEVKKALLQSAPWMGIAILAALALIFRRPSVGTPMSSTTLLAAWIPVAIVLVFSLAGRGRDDGLCFNQRYLLETVPFGALLFGIQISSVGARRVSLLAGGTLGAALAAAALDSPFDDVALQRAILYLPLALALVLTLAVLANRPLRRFAPPIAAASIGWALILHLGTDLRASRAHRETSFLMAQQALEVIPEGSAIVTWSGSRDFLGSVALDRRITVAHAPYDDGATAPELIRTFLGQGRRVFVWTQTMPRSTADSILRDLEHRPLILSADHPVVVEVR